MQQVGQYPGVSEHMMITVLVLPHVVIHENSQNDAKNDGENADKGVHAQTHDLEGNVALPE